MSDPYPYPPIPTRIVEPVVSPETVAPTRAVPCEHCTISGNDALTAAAKRGRKNSEPKPDLSTPTDDEAAE